MTKLKINVEAVDDEFATQILRDILQHWKDAGSLSTIQGAFTCGLSEGTATAGSCEGASAVRAGCGLTRAAVRTNSSIRRTPFRSLLHSASRRSA